MILADTNIWIAHFDRGDSRLAYMLPRREVVIHPYVIGEVALGRLPDRAAALADMHLLPPAEVARHEEVMRLIDTAEFAGSGLGYVDAHLVASCLLMPGSRLWTRDRKLRRVADRLSIAADLA